MGYPVFGTLQVHPCKLHGNLLFPSSSNRKYPHPATYAKLDSKSFEFNSMFVGRFCSVHQKGLDDMDVILKATWRAKRRIHADPA